MIRDIIKGKMIEAMKAKDKEAKNAYSYMLDQIQKTEKNMQSKDNPNPKLTEAEEIAVVQKLVKQARDAIAKTQKEVEGKNVDISAFVAAKEAEIAIYSQFVPKEMTADEINAIIKEVAESLPTPLNRGMLMKNIMVKIKNSGNADGKLVAALADKYIKEH